MCIILIIISLYAVVSVVPNDAQYFSSSKISYTVEEFSYCRFTYKGIQVEGECKSFENCPVAIDLWKKENYDPITCFFEKDVHKVCCPKTNPSSEVRRNLTLTVKDPSMEKILSPNRRRTTTSVNPTTDSTVSTTTKSGYYPFLPPLNLTINEDCTIPGSSINGRCTKYTECRSAMKNWRTTQTTPIICNDDIVCCLDNKNARLSATPKRRLRKNEIHCNSLYGLVFHNSGGGGGAIGEPAKPKEFPYMVALGWRSAFDNSTSYRCGGVLIDPSFVLTAAHCTFSRDGPPNIVKVGGTNLTDTDPRIAILNIAEVIAHPFYDSGTNDIALLRLETSIHIERTCLWNEKHLELNNLTAIGYGNIRFAGPSSDQLIKAHLLAVPTSECQKSYDEELLDTHICAGESKNDTCQGDSGGPLLMYRDSKFYPYVVGITAFGNPCGSATPGVYTRVSEFINWIESIVWNK